VATLRRLLLLRPLFSRGGLSGDARGFRGRPGPLAL